MEWHGYIPYRPIEGVDRPLDLLPRPLARREHRHFLQQQPDRLSELSKLLGHFDIALDYSLESVVNLNNWFNKNVQIYRGEKGVVNTWGKLGSSVADAPNQENHTGSADVPQVQLAAKVQALINEDPVSLVDAWYSVSIDATMYLGRIIMDRCPEAHWKFVDRPKSDFAYQRTVLSGFPKASPRFHMDTDWMIGISPFGKYAQDDKLFLRFLQEALDLC